MSQFLLFPSCVKFSECIAQRLPTVKIKFSSCKKFNIKSGLLCFAFDVYFLLQWLSQRKITEKYERNDRSLFCQRLLRTMKIIHKNKREKTYISK